MARIADSTHIALWQGPVPKSGPQYSCFTMLNVHRNLERFIRDEGGMGRSGGYLYTVTHLASYHHNNRFQFAVSTAVRNGPGRYYFHRATRRESALDCTLSGHRLVTAGLRAGERFTRTLGSLWNAAEQCMLSTLGISVCKVSMSVLRNSCE